mmetsp:Transcript_62675/g.132407  ORF Transcript_62675/g.132407 Transcript_62675/m.132407 type:complete len:194 (-) Transcript_62675:484-1065(-)
MPLHSSSSKISSLWALLGLSILVAWAQATIRMPEEFNVEQDFSEKEKWRKVQRFIRCDLCQLLVSNTAEVLGENYKEDDVYDHIDNICDAEEIYDKHYLKNTPGGSSEWILAPAEEADERAPNTKRWQSHSMKELCDNIIKPADDEIKDTFMKVKKKRAKGKGKISNEDLVTEACAKARLCPAGSPGKKNSEL